MLVECSPDVHQMFNRYMYVRVMAVGLSINPWLGRNSFKLGLAMNRTNLKIVWDSIW